MPILYVHGVNVRSREGFARFQKYARRYLAPAISDDPDRVTISDVFWGDLAFSPAWDGASRPRSRLFGMGADDLSDAAGAGLETEWRALDRLAQDAMHGEDGMADDPLAAAGASDDAQTPDTQALLELSDAELSDLLAVIVTELVSDPDADLNLNAEISAREEEAALVLAADALVSDGTARDLLEGPDPEAAIDALVSEIRSRAESDAELAGQGLGDVAARLGDRLREATTRVRRWKGFAASAVLVEARGLLHDTVARFLGDVFVYVKNRGDAQVPGAIPKAFLDKLVDMQAIKQTRGGEPLIVVTHSMGGQLVYDAVTHYLPNDPELRHIKVDFWCAAASQVGYFEEAKLFHASDDAYKTGNPVPFPSENLGAWWNVWDHNDVISFTVKDIIAGVDDESYSSGLSVVAAHGGYLAMPSFYRKMANKIQAATTAS